MFKFSQPSIFISRNNGVYAQAFFYDKEGKMIQENPQTVVNGIAGIFYMQLIVKVSNTGNVKLTNLAYSSVSPVDFANALQNQVPLQTSILVGENKVLILDTANTCTSDGDCGIGEKCILPSGQAQKKCFMDISNKIGLITYNITILSNYTSAYGQSFQILSPVSLSINFSQDEVIFRTDVLNRAYGTSGKQVAVDRASDGTMESYVFNIAGTGAYYSSQFITYTSPDTPSSPTTYHLVYQCGTTSDICISQETGLDKTITQTSNSRWKYSSGGTLATSKIPTEPYKSTNCGGIMPCQERYSIAVTPQNPVCGNNLKEGTELCDGTDLGGNDCTTIGMSFTGGTLSCSSCTLWNTDSCTGAVGGKVSFRTYKSDLSNSVTNDDAIAFLITGASCGSILTRAGEYSSTGGTGTSGQLCSALMPTLGTGYTKILDIPTGVVSITRGSYTANSNFALWNKSNDYVICGDNPRPVYLGFRLTSCASNQNCPSLSNSSDTINSNLETTC